MNLSWYVPKSNVEHIIRGKETISILDQSSTTPSCTGRSGGDYSKCVGYPCSFTISKQMGYFVADFINFQNSVKMSSADFEGFKIRIQILSVYLQFLKNTFYSVMCS